MRFSRPLPSFVRGLTSALTVLSVFVAVMVTGRAMAAGSGPAVFINEIHYDNAGTDTGEFIEIAGPAGTSLTGYSLELYNGSGGALYTTTALSGVIPDQQNGFGTVTFAYPVNGIQNGSPDGMALVHTGTVIQFLSYEGVFTATGSGTASGMTSTDIGVSENGTESASPVTSLQLHGSGTNYGDFTWTGPITNTSGAVNTGQAFAGGGGPSPSPSPSPSPTPTPSPSPTAAGVVISQIYGGGGNTGATFQNDYVELYNASSTPFDVTGWSIQYASSGGDFTQVQPLAGLIGPSEYYLVALGSNGTVGDALPVLPNVSGDINLSATTGKVALARNSDPVTSTCPPNDPDLADYVGYGSSASCAEGGAKAPAPSNSTALFRRNGGAQDTDNNASDFQTGTPAPRRTSPILEVGPRVQTTDPFTNGTDAPRDASVTVTFSEDVTVDPGWYQVGCATTGSHDDAVVAGGPRTFVVTPSVNFLAGESCTVTLHKDSVHDVDLDDAGPNTDTLPADYVWTFTVTAAGTPPPYPPEVHLTMGNPSGAVADADNSPDNYLMVKPEYALSYNRDLGRPNWVSWHLDDLWAVPAGLVRVDTFRPDPALPVDWYRVQATDFFTTGFDRGHMTPNADREFPNSRPINQATYLMTNMVAQAPDNNQGPWADFENFLRTLLPANEIYIVSGPFGAGGTGDNGGLTTTLAGGHVTVPAQTWKVALVLPKEAGDDVSRVTASTRTIAVVMPNVDGIKTSDANDWKLYLTTVDAVEALTGYDFFSNVDPAVQNAIEAGLNGVNPPGVADQTVTADEDTPKDFTLRAVSASAGPLTYVIDTAPTHGAITGSDGARTYVPVSDFSGTDSFTFHVSDGVRTSNTATVTVQVLEVNDSPTAGDDAKTTDEDVPLVFAAADLTVNDVAGPANEAGQTLTVTSVTTGANSHGTVVLAGGQVTYAPEPNFNGTASFVYEVCDDGRSGGVPDSKCATGTVTVAVAPVNDAPVFTSVPAPATTPEGSPYTFTAQATDVDGQALTFSLIGAPAGAAIDPVTGHFTWTPTEAQGGTGVPYQFLVRVSDGLAHTDASVVVSVSEVNVAPTLSVPGHFTVSFGQTLTFTAAGSDTDLPPQALTYGLSGAVPAGAAIDATTGAFSWTPTAAQSGPSYAFDVTVSDGLASAAATVTVTVVDVTPPTLVLPTGITAVATSPAGAVVTYTATASDLVDGPRPVTCAPASGSTFAIGTTTVSCSASDAHGNRATGSFTVKVSTPDLPGRMIADAVIDLGSVRHDFAFVVQERASGADAGALSYRVTTRQRGRDQEDRFDSTAITSVSFFNVPGVSPGPRPPSGVDTVSFSGVGRWNGRSGFRFDALAVDAGEPGRRRDSFRITVRDAAGHVVASVDADITGGNIESLRLWY